MQAPMYDKKICINSEGKGGGVKGSGGGEEKLFFFSLSLST